MMAEFFRATVTGMGGDLQGDRVPSVPTHVKAGAAGAGYWGAGAGAYTRPLFSST